MKHMLLLKNKTKPGKKFRAMFFNKFVGHMQKIEAYLKVKKKNALKFYTRQLGLIQPFNNTRAMLYNPL